MSNEEFQQEMDFIVGRQAQFASDMQLLRESQAQTDNVVARLAYVTLEGFKDVTAKIDALVDSQIRTDEKLTLTHERFTAKMDALVDAQMRTDETLRNLIERQRNGH